MALHEVAVFLEFVESLVARQKFARVGNILLHQFLHLLLEFFQILGSESRRAVEIVEESSIGRRTVTELGFRKKFEHRRGQQVGGRMPIHFQRLRIFFGQDAEAGVFFQRLGQVNEIAISLSHQSRIRQPRADGFGNLERGRPFRNFFFAPIRELYMNAVCHK